MEIFVRTSNKERFLIIDCVQYTKIKETQTSINALGIKEPFAITKHFISCCGTRLGEYATKERCIEIINEIQQIVKENSYQNIIVYDMPET